MQTFGSFERCSDSVFFPCRTLEEIDVGMLLDSDNPLDDMFDFIYELLALAVMHRIVACIYEVSCANTVARQRTLFAQLAMHY